MKMEMLEYLHNEVSNVDTGGKLLLQWVTNSPDLPVQEPGIFIFNKFLI